MLNGCVLLPDPADPRTLYLLHESVGIGGGGDLLDRTLDGGRTWTPLSLRSLVFQTNVLPTSPTTLLVRAYDTTNYRDYVMLASRDRGETWTRSGAGLPGGVFVAVDPARPGRIVGATPAGAIFRSVDAGRTWTPAGPPMRRP